VEFKSLLINGFKNPVSMRTDSKSFKRVDLESSLKKWIDNPLWINQFSFHFQLNQFECILNPKSCLKKWNPVWKNGFLIHSEWKKIIFSNIFYRKKVLIKEEDVSLHVFNPIEWMDYESSWRASTKKVKFSHFIFETFYKFSLKLWIFVTRTFAIKLFSILIM